MSRLKRTLSETDHAHSAARLPEVLQLMYHPLGGGVWRGGEKKKKTRRECLAESVMPLITSRVQFAAGMAVPGVASLPAGSVVEEAHELRLATSPPPRFLRKRPHKLGDQLLQVPRKYFHPLQNRLLVDIFSPLTSQLCKIPAITGHRSSYLVVVATLSWTGGFA